MSRNNYSTFKRATAAFLVIAMIILCGCTNTQKKTTSELAHRYASKEEGVSLLLENKEYYDGFSQNDIDYRMQKKNAAMDEYLAFAKEQVLDYTDEEKQLIDSCFDYMNNTLKENGYALPATDEIVLVKTTMAEEGGAGGYTHGTKIFLSSELLDAVINAKEEEKDELLSLTKEILWHELFHCLTRCNPEFRAKMYELINFTVKDKDFNIPKSVFEYHISNPDVEHHNSYATFRINGKDVDCFVDCVTTKHFEKEGESFFDNFTTALVPVDGTDIYYTPEQAENFDEVFGKNTDYVIDPEECMADNFAYAMLYGMDGPEGNGYASPKIIEGILANIKEA